MLWAVFSLGSGIFASLQGAYSKKGLISEQFHDWTIMLVRFIYVLPLFILFWVFEKMPRTITSPSLFALIILILIILEVASQWTFHQSIKISSLSLVMPFQNLTPLFIIPINFLIFHKLPSTMGFMGILISTMGLFLLFKKQPKLPQNKKGDNKKLGGVGLMIITSVLWALTTTLQKIGIQFAGVSLFGVLYIGGVVILMLIYHWVKRISLRSFFEMKNFHVFLPIGIFAGLSTLTQYLALPLANPAYVNALKRTGNVTNIFWDRSFFGESISIWYITGNILAILGAVLLVLS